MDQVENFGAIAKNSVGKSMIYQLYKTNKTPLKLSNNVEKFLNGLTSNDLNKSNNAFLDIHGRIVATFDQVWTGDDEMIICIEAPFVDEFLKHVEKYVMLSKVKIERLSHYVYFDLDANQNRTSGGRLGQKQGQLVITEDDLETNVSDDEFTLFRLQNNIPIHGVDFQDELLLNVSTEEFVSFTKGCYLGQEPISKVYNRSKPTWKLVVKYEDECSPEEQVKMTSKILNPQTQRIVGFVFVKN